MATELTGVEDRVRLLLNGRMLDFRLIIRDEGLVLQGHAPNYYAKQLAQEMVKKLTTTPIRANDIEVDW
jgi:hypothetical protein